MFKIDMHTYIVAERKCVEYRSHEDMHTEQRIDSVCMTCSGVTNDTIAVQRDKLAVQRLGLGSAPGPWIRAVTVRLRL